MNHFELFGLEEALYVDKAVLKQRFYELARQWHPDRFMTKSTEEQVLALERTAQLNKGFKILSDPLQCLAYFMKLKGVLGEDEKYQLPADFLMQMMDLNENIEDVKNANDAEVYIAELKQIQHELDAEFEEIEQGVKNFNDFSADQKAALKKYYFKTKYLLRIKESLLRFATH